MNLKDLSQKIPFKWRIQSFSKSSASASCVAYIDARDVMSMLDEIIGPENWQSDYKEIKGNLYAGVAIRINDEWIWKWDCGTESNTEKEKGEASDSFKRAAVKWGIGRFLYDIPMQYIKTSEAKTNNNYPYPIDDYGNKVKDLSTYLNQNNKVTYMKSKYKRNEESLPSKNSFQQQSDKEVNLILQKIENCNSLDELRIIREENIKLETENNYYKKALAKKYEVLNEKNKSEKAI